MFDIYIYTVDKLLGYYINIDMDISWLVHRGSTDVPTLYEVCSESNAQGKISSQWCMLERWHTKLFLRRLFSVWQLLSAHSSDQHRQGRSKNLKNHGPLQSRLRWRSTFSSPRAPGLQKNGKNKNVGQQNMVNHVDHSNKFYH
jgi:hypothetical protein